MAKDRAGVALIVEKLKGATPPAEEAPPLSPDEAMAADVLAAIEARDAAALAGALRAFLGVGAAAKPEDEDFEED